MGEFPSGPFPTATPKGFPTKEMKELFSAIVSIRTPTEAAKFFRDLLTMPEIREFANRWQIVKMLYQKKSYAIIAKRLNVSTATVTRVAYWLRSGQGGYKAVANRIFPARFKDADVPGRYYRTGKYRGLRRPTVT